MTTKQKLRLSVKVTGELLSKYAPHLSEEKIENLIAFQSECYVLAYGEKKVKR